MAKYRCTVCGTETDRAETYREDWGEELVCCPRCCAPIEPAKSTCVICEAAVDGETKVCEVCAEQICLRYPQAVAEWLGERHGEIGWFSWEDFVLGEVFGVRECTDSARLAAVLTPTVVSESGLGERLWRYFCADRDSFGELARWIGVYA